MAIGLADRWWVELDCVWLWLGLGSGGRELVSDSVATLSKGSNPCASSRAGDRTGRWWLKLDCVWVWLGLGSRLVEMVRCAK